MQVRFIAQPHGSQLGKLFLAELGKSERPSAVTIVSAFVSRASVHRLKSRLRELRAAGTKVRLVIGVDMGGTSKEVLRELYSWSPIETFVFKNKKVGVTFHPKIYVIERDHVAELFVGSNNLTDGGLFKNYESAVHLSYSLPADAASFADAKIELSKFLDPEAPIAKLLDEAYLTKLLAREDIPSEAESRQRAKKAKVGSPSLETDDAFGFEPTPGALELPPDYQDLVLSANSAKLSEIKRGGRKGAKSGSAKTIKRGGIMAAEPLAQMAPISFYMELNATGGKRAKKGGKSNIPGEQRIPLPAIWSAQDYWGWPDNYALSINPGANRKRTKNDDSPEKEKVDRIYHNWYPVWKLSLVGDPAKTVQKIVRMYFYENSSDFRFTAGELKSWGGEPGDIVKITRVDDGVVDFTCELVKKTHSLHAKWATYCKTGEKTDRGYGFD
ncbi:restriction endonuclease PLD domain-containing protein [Burkholderia vietnamiensis]|uniref:restriction endonuclease PLD domain-containing protein n=1 Tax=Burkholderia vietnamiensis TaxID=60552 RepID=UPI00158CF379|nr:phospholipase D-like domain-containing protein [Burkholderia vietnamiensis]